MDIIWVPVHTVFKHVAHIAEQCCPETTASLSLPLNQSQLSGFNTSLCLKWFSSVLSSASDSINVCCTVPSRERHLISEFEPREIPKIPFVPFVPRALRSAWTAGTSRCPPHYSQWEESTVCTVETRLEGGASGDWEDWVMSWSRGHAPTCRNNVHINHWERGNSICKYNQCNTLI